MIGADAANGLRSVDVPFANFGLAGTVAVAGLMGGLELNYHLIKSGSKNLINLFILLGCCHARDWFLGQSCCPCSWSRLSCS